MEDQCSQYGFKLIYDGLAHCVNPQRAAVKILSYSTTDIQNYFQYIQKVVIHLCFRIGTYKKEGSQIRHLSGEAYEAFEFIVNRVFQTPECPFRSSRMKKQT